MPEKTETVLDMIAAYEDDTETALMFADEELSYRDMIAASRRFARELVRCGVRKGDRILLNQSRSLTYYVHLLGILAAGGIFIPSDPDWPDLRRQQILLDSQASLMVTKEAVYAVKNGEAKEAVQLMDDPEVRLPLVQGDDTFAIFYTSGSTGRPKGTVLAHEVLLDNSIACQENFFVTDTARNYQRVLILLNPVYAFVMLDVFAALCNGKTLILATEEEFHSPKALARCLEGKKVEALSITPSLLERFLTDASFSKAYKGVKRTALSGEKVSTMQAELFLTKSEAKLYNGYGSSETLHLSDWLCEPGKPIYIGAPNKGVVMHVLREDGSQAATGEKGELFIAGPAARYGRYLGREDLTAQRFVTHPELGRLYKTGDGALRTPEGEIQLTGRIDDVIKLHGQRIEPGEIERAICEYPGIDQAAVRLHGEGAEAQLCGYFTASAPIDLTSLRLMLSKKLPHYMVPVSLTKLDEMPLTISGKLDRKALPKPQITAEGPAYVAPTDETETLLAQLFQEYLEISRPVGTQDNFFFLGGDSIKGMQIVSAAMEHGLRFKLSDLFANPTVQQLSEHLKAVLPKPGSATEGAGGPAGISGAAGNTKQEDEAGLPADGWKEQLSAEEKDAITKLVPWEDVEAVYPFLTTPWDRIRFDGDDRWICQISFSVSDIPSESQLKARLEELTAKRQALRMIPAFPEGKRPLIVARKKAEIPLYMTDLREPEGTENSDGKLSDRQQSEVLSVLNQFLEDGFAPNEAFFRVHFFRTGNNHWLLCVLFCHFFMDGTGAHRLVEELLNDAPLSSDAELVNHYFRRQASDTYLAEAAAQWRKLLPPGSRITELPAKSPADGASDKKTSGKSSRRTPIFRYRKLSLEPARAYCQAHQVTLAAVIHTALGRAIASLTGQEQVCFLTIGSGRTSTLTEDQRLTGMYSFDYPFVYKKGEQPADSQQQLLDTLDYMAYDYHLLDGCFTNSQDRGVGVRCNLLNHTMAKGARVDNSFLLQDDARELLTYCPRDILFYLEPEDELYVTNIYLPGVADSATVSALNRAFAKELTKERLFPNE